MRVFMVLLMLSAAPVSAAWTQQQLAEFAQNTSLQFSLQSNMLDTPSRFSAAITLQNNSAHALPTGEADWQIYFHLIRRLEAAHQQGLQIEHVQGDLHRIRPTASFAGLKPSQKLTLPFESAPWMVSYSDFMPRAFIAFTSLQAEVFSNTDTENFSQFVKPISAEKQQQRNMGEPDQVPVVDAALRFSHNTQLNSARINDDVSTRIIPTPMQAEFAKRGGR